MHNNSYELDYRSSAAESIASERAAFVRRVYLHLAGAILALIGLEAALINTIPPMDILSMFRSGWSFLIVMLLFMGAGMVARMWAQSRSSPALQYLGLGLYIAVWAVMFLPLITIANLYPQFANVIPQAGIMTGAVFGGLTLAVFITRKDYSFLAPVLTVGSLIALGVIVCAIVFGFSLGLFFLFAMVALIAGTILYNTSNVMLHYPTDMHVAAALELFADVAILFYYIVNILMRLNSRD